MLRKTLVMHLIHWLLLLTAMLREAVAVFNGEMSLPATSRKVSMVPIASAL